MPESKLVTQSVQNNSNLAKPQAKQADILLREPTEWFDCSLILGREITVYSDQEIEVI